MFSRNSLEVTMIYHPFLDTILAHVKRGVRTFCVFFCILCTFVFRGLLIFVSRCSSYALRTRSTVSWTENWLSMIPSISSLSRLANWRPMVRPFLTVGPFNYHLTYLFFPFFFGFLCFLFSISRTLACFDLISQVSTRRCKWTWYTGASRRKYGQTVVLRLFWCSLC